MKIEIEIPDSEIEAAAKKSTADLGGLVAVSLAKAIRPHLGTLASLDTDKEAECVYVQTHVTFVRRDQDRNAYANSTVSVAKANGNTSIMANIRRKNEVVYESVDVS